MPNHWQNTVAYAQTFRRKSDAHTELSWQEYRTAEVNARNLWRELYGAQTLEHGHAMPPMASADFSCLLQEIPRVFALIELDDRAGHHEPCHSHHYEFNNHLIADFCRRRSCPSGLPAF